MNLTAIGIFGIMFLAVIAIISNTGATSISNIQHQFDRIACPLPSQSGLWNSSGTIVLTGATYNYPNVGNQTITLTCTGIHTTNGVDYLYGAPGVALGVFFYIGDYVSEILANKVSAFFTIVYYILTPANFNVLGYTISDLAGIALMFVIAIYAICYIAVGAWLYKVLSPFAGAGG
jgi:hypothetical protein